MSAVIESHASRPRAVLVAGDPDRPLAYGPGGALVRRATLVRHVLGVAATLPHAPFVVNLCEDRYRFLVAFCAAASRGQVTLLPSSRAPAAVLGVQAAHPGSYCLGDRPLPAPPDGFHCLPPCLPEADGPVPEVDVDARVAIGFTSGSTGQPAAHDKYWDSFTTSTRQNLAALEGLLDPRGSWLVATVPPQHMYGMELSVLLPLLGPVAVHMARPFFPAEVAAALADSPAPPLLATTPVHLRALVESGLALPPLAGIVSATAPLPRELAATAEARFGCEVREVFGSTETCVFARRRTAREDAWTPLPGVRLAPRPDGTLVHAEHLAAPVPLADLFELHADGRFELRGRQADLLEIAGKRASLAELTRRLLEVPGVADGAVFQLDPDAAGVRRIAAVAVAPGRAPGEVLGALRQHVDPVFLPRRLRLVTALPREESGKLPRHRLLALFA